MALIPVRGILALRAQRERLSLRCADGTVLVGELSVPLEEYPQATLVFVHPLPETGGSADAPLVRKAALRLPELAQCAVLRWNTRGTNSRLGHSGGTFGDGETEQHDLRAVHELVRSRGLPDPWLVGWSFGADIVLKHGLSLGSGARGDEMPAPRVTRQAAPTPRVAGAIVLSPTLRRTSEQELAAWAQADAPQLHAILPERDHIVAPSEVLERLRVVPHAHTQVVPGGTHLWAGETHTQEALRRVIQIVRPGFGSLPAFVSPEQIAVL